MITNWNIILPVLGPFHSEMPFLPLIHRQQGFAQFLPCTNQRQPTNVLIVKVIGRNKITSSGIQEIANARNSAENQLEVFSSYITKR